MQRFLIGFLTIGLVMACTSVAYPVVMGLGDLSTPAFHEYYDVEGGNTITIPGGTGQVDIYYDPSKGPWRKTFQQIGGPTLNIIENLHVMQNPAWTDWDEQIVGPAGWVWANNPLPTCVLGGNGSGTVFGTISADQQSVVFDFAASPLAPSTNLTITKTLSWRGGGNPPGTVTIDQWPTVPEPGTFVLLAAGLFTLVLGYCRRRR